jgi:hypothetical protein
VACQTSLKEKAKQTLGLWARPGNSFSRAVDLLWELQGLHREGHSPTVYSSALALVSEDLLVSTLVRVESSISGFYAKSKGRRHRDRRP